MNYFPKVSVSVLSYNHQDFIEECLDSILAQDYPNLEIVVGDDFSKDQTRSILEKYKEKYPDKIKLIFNEKNLGITKNSNVTFKSCDGKYVAFMGGDDLMLPGKISSQVEFMEKNPNCCISYHNLEVFESETKRILRQTNDEKNSFQGGVELLIEHGTFNGACATMIRRDCAPINGYDERIPIASDWLFWVETAVGGGEILYIDKVLGRHRRHSNNITNEIDVRFVKNIQDDLNTCCIILTKYPQYSWQALKRFRTEIRFMRKIKFFDYRQSLLLGSSLGDFKSFVLYLCNLLSFGYWRP